VKVEVDEQAAEGQEEDPTVFVYELWQKASRTVTFLCEEYEENILRTVTTDPLKLAGFYPTPGPLTLVRKPSDLCPTPLFMYYKNQAEELNRVTVRLNKVLAAIRVKGVYHPFFAEDMSSMLAPNSGENELIAGKKAVDLAAIGGLDKAIWMLPIEKLITVADQLYKARQSILQVIYQITGMADIVRGASVASESATAQNLKDKWGNLRLRRAQRTVQLYVRDLLRLAVDAASTVLTPEQWAMYTGLPYPFLQQKQQAMLAYQQQAMLAQQSEQQPPPPPPQQLAWEEVVATLAADEQRCYIIDIETSSTLDQDAAGDKQEVAEFMTGFSQLTQSLAPLVSLGPQGMSLAKELTLAVIRRFKLGREVEEAVKALQPPQQQPGENPAEKAKAEAEMRAIEMEGKLKEKEYALKERDMQRKEALAEQQHRLAMQRLAQQAQQAQMNALMPPRQPAKRA